MVQNTQDSYSKEFSHHLNTWRQRHFHRDIFQMWRSAPNHTLREQFAFTIIVTMRENLKLMDGELLNKVINDGEEYLLRLEKFHKAEGLNPTTAAITFARDKIEEIKKHNKEMEAGKDIVKSAHNIAETALHEIWRRAVSVYPMSDETIGAMSFLVVNSLGSYGLRQIKPEFCRVIILAAARHCSRAMTSRLRGKTPEPQAVQSALNEIREYIRTSGINPFDISHFSKYGSQEKQLRGLWDDVKILVDATRIEPEESRDVSLAIWRRNEKMVAYNWAAMDADSAAKSLGRESIRLFVGAAELAKEIGKNPKLATPKIAKNFSSLPPEEVFKRAIYHLPNIAEKDRLMEKTEPKPDEKTILPKM